jgi:ubiquinone/menaquinone biosynthesis C-methylase UbiE
MKPKIFRLPLKPSHLTSDSDNPSRRRAQLRSSGRPSKSTWPADRRVQWCPRPGYVSHVLFAIVAILAVATLGIAKETVPPAPTHYMGREIAVTMHYLGAPWLVRESRQREEDCEQLLKALKIEPGQTVCDMGCGNGFYSLQLAEMVGEKGQVIAVDIQREMLGYLRSRARIEGISNIKPLLGTPVDPRLEPNSVDLVFMVDVYHEFSHPEQMLKAIRESLKPKGRVALVEFREEDPNVPIKPLHKMSKAQIMKEFPANGLKLVEEYDKLPWQHLMFFEVEAGRNHESNE